MPNTTNNNWPTPADTDLVKNGADAIRDLGNAIDTTLGVYQASGLVKLNTTSFSNVASQSVNDVFSATFRNYKIVCNAVNSADSVIKLRLRISGTDNTSSNYWWSTHYNSSTTGTVSGNVSSGAATSFDLFDIGTVDGGSNSVVDFYNPFLTKRTGLSGINTYVPNSDNINYTVVRSGATTVSTSYTGFTIFPSSGTMTGSVSVYGYNV
jgi:hypothetical protein